MRSQEPFSYEQHRDAADLLCHLRREVARLERELDASYGPNAAADAHSVMSALDRLSLRLDKQLDRDFPRDGAGINSIRLGSIYCAETRLAG